jgi:hypothetical protein
MDQRQTFADSAELLRFLIELFKDGRQAALLVDSGGLERMQGMIAMVSEDGKYITLSSNTQHPVPVQEIVGVNGIFRGDYSEC